MTKSKLKGNRESSWCRVGVQEIEKAREDVVVLITDVWHSPVIDFGCADSRTLWVKFKYSRVKACGMFISGPTEVGMRKNGRNSRMIGQGCR